MGSGMIPLGSFWKAHRSSLRVTNELIRERSKESGAEGAKTPMRLDTQVAIGTIIVGKNGGIFPS